MTTLAELIERDDLRAWLGDAYDEYQAADRD